MYPCCRNLWLYYMASRCQYVLSIWVSFWFWGATAFLDHQSTISKYTFMGVEIKSESSTWLLIRIAAAFVLCLLYLIDLNKKM